MKRKYDPAELEIIVFDACDVITTSGGGAAGAPDDGGNVGNNQGVFGGSYDPNGWT